MIVIMCFLLTSGGYSQALQSKDAYENHAFKSGEWLRYRMSYSNFLNAGYATIEVKDTSYSGKEAYHINGVGKSTGLVSVFFKVRDNYQSFMYKETLQPYRFIRDINEGGHTRHKDIYFDYKTEEATVKNLKHNTVKKHPISSNIQDMLSTLYYLRNQDFSTIEEGYEVDIKMFYDSEIFNFKLRFLERETISVNFGHGRVKVKALKFKPMVQAGRVFEEEESLTVWVSDDKNKVPLRIKASLTVGSLRADLNQYKGLAHPFNIIFDN